MAYGTTNGYGNVNIPTSGSSFAKSTIGMAYSNSATVYPEINETNITIDASSTGWNDQFNDD